MKKWNIGLAAFFIVLAVSIFYSTREYAVNSGFDPGAAFWPRALSTVLIGLSLIMVVQTMIRKADNEEKRPPIVFTAPEMRLVYWMLGVFAMYAIILYFGGFIIASLLFIPAVMFLLGESRVLNLVLASVIFTGVVYLFFSILLRITLPQPFFM